MFSFVGTHLRSHMTLEFSELELITRKLGTASLYVWA